MPKWGFESEWQQGADDLTEKLYAMELVGDSGIHGYHCRCDDCSFEHSRYPLRVQRDSSCAGEVISSPFHNWTDSVNVMSALQTAAVEVDAEPGMNAGFHVHVDMNEASTQHKADVVYGFGLWEPFIIELAKGRFESMRGMNALSQRYLKSYDYDFGRRDITPAGRVGAYDWYRSQDRHCNLNCRTSYGTFEFRIWNSTRSAWRMELFTRLSVALANRNVASALISNRQTWEEMGWPGGFTNVITDDRVTAFKAALRTGRQGACIDLLDRQLRYIRDGRMTDMEFTAA